MLIKKIQNTSIILFALTLFACGKSKLSPADYIGWCDTPENGLIKEFIQGPIKLTCQYMPSEYTVLKQNNPDHLNQNEIIENSEALANLIQYKLTFENTESANFLKDNYTTADEFNTRSMYLSYGIQSDLELVSNLDTAVCNMNHHERTYGNTPYETLLISFPKTANEITDLELIFNDRVFGLGRVKFFYSSSLLQDIPELKFE